jgi:hypothetical protein
MQGSGQSKVELFDTLIAAAKHSEDEDDEKDEKNAEDEEREVGEEEKKVDNEENVRTHEQTQECTRRNQARREAEGELATSK